jgi:hypothetical protein
VLKGGVALELRLDRARTTKDVDLRFTGSPDDLLPRLQALAQLDLGDFMTSEIEPDPHHPEIQNEGMIYEGQRFRAECPSRRTSRRSCTRTRCLARARTLASWPAADYVDRILRAGPGA